MALSVLGYRDSLFESNGNEAISVTITRYRDHRKFLVLVTV